MVLLVLSVVANNIINVYRYARANDESFGRRLTRLVLHHVAWACRSPSSLPSSPLSLVLCGLASSPQSIFPLPSSAPMTLQVLFKTSSTSSGIGLPYTPPSSSRNTSSSARPNMTTIMQPRVGTGLIFFQEVWQRLWLDFAASRVLSSVWLKSGGSGLVSISLVHLFVDRF